MITMATVNVSLLPQELVDALQKVLNNAMCLHRKQVGVWRAKKAAKKLADGSRFHTCFE